MQRPLGASCRSVEDGGGCDMMDVTWCRSAPGAVGELASAARTSCEVHVLVKVLEVLYLEVT